jgi:long-chain acyl-CoA synthetase
MSTYDSIPRRLTQQAEARPNAPAYCVRDASGTWRPTDWKTYAAEVREAARALVGWGLGPGDRVCILGFNRPEWVIFDVAAMMAGGVPAGIYTTCSPAEVQYIVEHAEAGIVLVESQAQWEKIDAERARLPNLRHVVTMKGVHVDDPLCMDWSTFVAKAAEVPQPVLDERLDAVKGDDVGTFIYTSGTTGPPKAVMLTHENLAWTAQCAKALSDVRADDRTVSYLPLSHIAEQMFSIHIPITVGACVYYARSMEALPEDLKEVNPTIFLGVPRVWEKMRAKIQTALDGATGVKARLAQWALGVGKRASATRNRGEDLDPWLRAQHALADRLVLGKVRARLGFDALRVAVTGAAPISRDVLEFFSCLGIIIHEVYGQSEGSGPTTFNVPGDTRFGTVGKPLPGTDVVLGDDGEIRVRGPHVFAGYFKNEAATSETLEDGWLLSGDLGAFDEDGFLRIVGRKKEIIITAGGKNIAPANIEKALKDIPLVSQAVVIGDDRPYLSALLTLDPEAAEAFRVEHGVNGEALHGHPKLRDALQAAIDAQVNPQFARVEHVRKFRILPRDFSVDDGELTPSLKIKRRVVSQNFAGDIEALYAPE